MANKNLFLESTCRHLLMIKDFPVLTRRTTAVILTLLLILSGPGIASAEWAEKIIDVGVVAQYDDNINRSFYEGSVYEGPVYGGPVYGGPVYGGPVKKDDFMLVPSASLGLSYQLADFTRLSATVDVKGEIHKDFDRLNSIFAGTTLAVSQKLGLGPYKPWLRVHGSGGYLEVNDDPNLRDSWLLDTGIKIGKRLTDRVDVEGGYTFDYRNGQNAPSVRPEAVSSGAVFDMDGHTGSVLSNVLLTNSLLLSLGYSFRHGDVASVCNGATVATIVDKIDAVTRDLAFDESLCVYRIRGNTHEFSVGTTYALGNHSSVNVNYTRMEGESQGLDYSNNLVNVSFNHNFQ